MAHALRRRGHLLPAARLVLAMNDAIVAVVSAFFIIGIAVGIIAVVAMSVLRAERRGDQGDHGEPSDEPPGPGRDDLDSGQHHRWPADTDNNFSGR